MKNDEFKYWKFVFPGRIPSKKNSTRRIRRGNRVFTVPSEAHEAWEEEMLWNLKSQERPEEPFQKCSCLVGFYVPDRRVADLTNKTESIMDVMVKAGIIKDDNWFCVGSLDLRFYGVDKQNPRCEVYILRGPKDE